MEKPGTVKSRLFIFLIEFVGYVRESHRDLERIINTAFRHYIKSKVKSKNGNFMISNFEKKWHIRSTNNNKILQSFRQILPNQQIESQMMV